MPSKGKTAKPSRDLCSSVCSMAFRGVKVWISQRGAARSAAYPGQNRSPSKSGFRDFVFLGISGKFEISSFCQAKKCWRFCRTKIDPRTSSTWLGTIIFGFSGVIYPPRKLPRSSPGPGFSLTGAGPCDPRGLRLTCSSPRARGPRGGSFLSSRHLRGVFLNPFDDSAPAR